MILTLTEGKSRETFFGFRLPIFTSLHPNNPQGFPSTHLLPMHALLSPHEAMINLAVSSKVTLSFRSTLFLSSSSLSSSEHPLSSRSYQEWDIAVRLEKSEVQNPKFKVQSSKFKVQSSKFKVHSTPPASKSPAPIMDLGAQDQQKNPKSEGLQWDLRTLELDLRFWGGLGLSPIGLENFRGGLSPSPPLNLKSNSKTLKSTSKMPKSCMLWWCAGLKANKRRMNHETEVSSNKTCTWEKLTKY